MRQATSRGSGRRGAIAARMVDDKPTPVVDLTDKLTDPVDVLFGTQLGGGTDTNRAIAYCRGLITKPADTILVPHQRPVRGRR